MGRRTCDASTSDPTFDNFRHPSTSFAIRVLIIHYLSSSPSCDINISTTNPRRHPPLVILRHHRDPSSSTSSSFDVLRYPSLFSFCGILRHPSTTFDNLRQPSTTFDILRNSMEPCDINISTTNPRRHPPLSFVILNHPSTSFDIFRHPSTSFVIGIVLRRHLSSSPS